ncbi:MarR family transcriptional regulator [Ferrovibrio sp.]|uniref:MarR family winged helix-turn-helix transcriptional regulator n=1 Tax=Ferrovibrio sp. TaxID=1917215 RepID=UPI0025C16559|nr:MarR family transcriptional regulator [Ferrovibrio sp.]MBX3456437.1 MarR family transcriptional regulator [Ferrovibrio sp.]
MSDAQRTAAEPSDRETATHRGDKLELRLWLRLLTCSSLIEREIRNALRQNFDTTLPRFDLLAQLDRAPDGLTMGELSGRMMVSAGNITGLTDRLVEEGLVKRTPSEHDRRSSRVRLTPEGKRAFDAITPIHEHWLESMMGDLSREEMRALMTLLAKLKNSARSHAPDNNPGENE